MITDRPGHTRISTGVCWESASRPWTSSTRWPSIRPRAPRARYLARGNRPGLADTLGAVPATPPRQVVDTLGAGDCLNAAVIDGLLRGLDPPTTVERAVRLASFKCGHHGFEGLIAAAGPQVLNPRHWPART